MMRAECTTPDGAALNLAVLTACRVEYGLGLPCDSFEIEVPWNREMAPILPRLYRCRLWDQETLRFTGVIDECRCVLDAAGAILQVSGRSLAALLLDTQVKAAEYQRATLQDMLDDYVYPAGIEQVDWEDMPPIENYRITSGSSRWQAVADFVEFSAGVTPRFLPDGTLVLRPAGSERMWRQETEAPLLAAELVYQRYGVLSEVTVVNRKRGVVETVRNEEFLARGGCAGRVINTSGENDVRAMRNTGEYRIRQSQQDAEQLILTLPGLTELLPGDQAAVYLEELGISGSLAVTGVTLEQNARGSRSRVELAL